MLKKFNKLYSKIIYQYTIFQEQNNLYTIKKGDSLSQIAKKFNISIDQLCKLNNITNKNKIFVGQVLKLKDINTNNNKIENKNINFFNDKSLSKDDYRKIYFIARVLYSETGTKTTDQQVLKVASVIYNRTKNKAAFPYAKDVYSVASSKSQFSCIDDPKNSNWKEFKPNLNNRTKNAMNIAYKLYKGIFQPIDKNAPKNKKYYMYIDHSLTDVPSKFYSKKYWKLVTLEPTQHFKFYSLQQKYA